MEYSTSIMTRHTSKSRVFQEHFSIDTEQLAKRNSKSRVVQKSVCVPIVLVRLRVTEAHMSRITTIQLPEFHMKKSVHMMHALCKAEAMELFLEPSTTNRVLSFKRVLHERVYLKQRLHGCTQLALNQRAYSRTVTLLT